MKKLLTVVALTTSLMWPLPVEAQAKPIYSVVMGGQCKKLILGLLNETKNCSPVLSKTVFDNGQFVYVFGFKTKGVLTPISFSGPFPKSLKPSQASLTVDTIRSVDEKDQVVQNKATGTCSVKSNFAKQKTAYKCVVTEQGGTTFNFEFQSDPKLLEYL